MANTRKRYETYHDAQIDRLFNAPPQDESGPDWMDMLLHDIEIEMVEPTTATVSSWLFWGAYVFLLGCLLGGFFMAVWLLGGF